MALQNENNDPDNSASYYRGEDGLLYCSVCHEPKEERYPDGLRLLGKFDKHPRRCACERARQEKAEQEKEEQRRMQEVERLRRICFADCSQYEKTFAASTVMNSGSLHSDSF